MIGDARIFNSYFTEIQSLILQIRKTDDNQILREFLEQDLLSIRIQATKLFCSKSHLKDEPLSKSLPMRATLSESHTSVKIDHSPLMLKERRATLDNITKKSKEENKIRQEKRFKDNQNAAINLFYSLYALTNIALTKYSKTILDRPKMFPLLGVFCNNQHFYSHCYMLFHVMDTYLRKNQPGRWFALVKNYYDQIELLVENLESRNTRLEDLMKAFFAELLRMISNSSIPGACDCGTDEAIMMMDIETILKSYVNKPTISIHLRDELPAFYRQECSIEDQLAPQPIQAETKNDFAHEQSEPETDLLITLMNQLEAKEKQTTLGACDTKGYDFSNLPSNKGPRVEHSFSFSVITPRPKKFLHKLLSKNNHHETPFGNPTESNDFSSTKLFNRFNLPDLQGDVTIARSQLAKVIAVAYGYKNQNKELKKRLDELETYIGTLADAQTQHEALLSLKQEFTGEIFFHTDYIRQCDEKVQSHLAAQKLRVENKNLAKELEDTKAELDEASKKIERLETLLKIYEQSNWCSEEPTSSPTNQFTLTKALAIKTPTFLPLSPRSSTDVRSDSPLCSMSPNSEDSTESNKKYDFRY